MTRPSNHSDPWADSVELDLSYKPFFQKTWGAEGEAAQQRCGQRGGRAGSRAGVAGPPAPQDRQAVAPISSRDLQTLRTFFESLRCPRHSYVRIRQYCPPEIDLVTKTHRTEGEPHTKALRGNCPAAVCIWPTVLFRKLNGNAFGKTL